jgi:DNA-binding LytR/AlgR family response regulator
LAGGARGKTSPIDVRKAATCERLALLDLNIGTESSMLTRMKLKELGVPLVFANGYGERATIAETLAAARVIQKPDTNDVEAALGKLPAAK